MWLQSGQYAYASGAKAISKKYIDGCSMWCAWDGQAYVCHSESFSNAAMSLITDGAEMAELLDSVQLHEGAKVAAPLRVECRAAWKERMAA